MLDAEMKNPDGFEIIFILYPETQYDYIGGRDLSDGELTARGGQRCAV